MENTFSPVQSKTDAPFWKSEETLAGERWVASRAEDEAAKQRWTTHPK